MNRRKRQRRFRISSWYGFIIGRHLEGTINEGPRHSTFMQTGQRVFAGWGVVSDHRWPTPKGGGNIFPIPAPKEIDRIAGFNRTFSHFRIRSLQDAKLCLDKGSPFGLAIPITSDWRTTSTGIISMPRVEAEFTEHHCVGVVSYDDSNKRFRFLNTWGPSWGRKVLGSCPMIITILFSMRPGSLILLGLGIGFLRRTRKPYSQSIARFTNALGNRLCSRKNLWGKGR